MSKLVNGFVFSCALTFAAAGVAHAGGLVQPSFDPGNFGDPLSIDNQYWPLAAGRHVVFYEVSDDECAVNDFIVTDQTRSFGGAYAGLTARVISDQAWLDRDCDGGRDVLLEDTLDWYAQDDDGNVWYFGEDTTEYLFDENGNPTGSSKAGSWEAGVDGAVAGLIMLAEPAHGMFYQQEFYVGIAEDRAKVLRVDVDVTTGLGEFSGCIVTKEWTPLSSALIEHKTYCPRLGLVLVEGFGQERGSGAEAVDLGLP